MELIASKARAERASAAAWHGAEPLGSALLRVPSPKLECLGWEPRFNEASVLPWLFFVPVHMLPRWQELPVEQLLCSPAKAGWSHFAALTVCLRRSPLPWGLGGWNGMDALCARAWNGFKKKKNSQKCNFPKQWCTGNC